MYDTILVPTDGSEPTETVVAHALNLAETYGATIHALYVINTGALPSPEVEFREEFLQEGERIGTEAVEAVADAAEDEGVEVVTNVLRGTPNEEILEYAEDNDVDLIVMGTHGRTGIRHVLLGSVAERVIRRSEVPVLLVRIAEE